MMNESPITLAKKMFT